MATWIFEPGHTSAEFRARHMMVTWVRGAFKDIHGRLELDWARCLDATFEGEIDASGIWSGEPTRDAHLRSGDFLDVENHPKITFAGRTLERSGAASFVGEVDLTIRGVTRKLPLQVLYHGEWKTPFWIGDENKGEITRAGFEASTCLSRHDFGVSWQSELPGGGLTAGTQIDIVIDAEAMLLEDLKRTGAIHYYRQIGAV
jgi:polyisoprenoid-binding protein YceI